METGEEQIRDTAAFEAVDPNEEVVKALFEAQGEQPERTEISREEFMILLEYQVEKTINFVLEKQGEYNQIQMQISQAQMQIFRAQHMKDKITTFETNKFGVKFFIDERGNLSVEAHPKKPAGFLPVNE